MTSVADRDGFKEDFEEIRKVSRLYIKIALLCLLTCRNFSSSFFRNLTLESSVKSLTAGAEIFSFSSIENDTHNERDVILN